MATRSHRAPLAAYVLHRYDWSESSVILDLFTREQGRLAMLTRSRSCAGALRCQPSPNAP